MRRTVARCPARASGSTGEPLPLSVGWNLVGVSGNCQVSTEEYLSGTGWKEVYGYDEDAGVWHYYIKGVGGPLSTLQPGEGYWVHVTVDTVWTIDW